jgi:predicted metal-dependent hydrolase
MQPDLLAEFQRRHSMRAQPLAIGSGQVALDFVRHPRARRYVLRVRRDGTVRVTIPRGGILAFAVEFARKNRVWIEEQIAKRRAEAERSGAWSNGTEILVRGEPVLLTTEDQGEIQVVRFAGHVLPVSTEWTDLRPVVEQYLWALADKELPIRTRQLAAQFQLQIGRVVVRNQHSRWGSCSARGTISLNWRLIQAPLFVRDYLITHELMHLRQMNHSPRFWRLVRAACADYPKAELWLNAHPHLLR